MNNKGFTLIEIMLGILIFSMVIIGGFQALTSIGYGKIKLIHDTDTEKQSIYFSEKFFEQIKTGGVLDYEEYFNRSIVNRGGVTPVYASGHYNRNSGYGNFSRLGVIGSTSYGTSNLGQNTSLYYCVSGNGIGNKLSGSGCIDNYNYSKDLLTNIDRTGTPQYYGQYEKQFIDYNSNYDADGGDEDGDSIIYGDDDDEFLGIGPAVFTGGTNVSELYLISGDKTARTLFRWTVKDDPNAPASAACNYGNGMNPTGSGCLGTIEFLQLEGKDWGVDHAISAIPGEEENNGVIDTWIVDEDFVSTGSGVVAGSNTNNYRMKLFPDSMNVSDFRVFAYPNGELKYNWKLLDNSLNISPYIRIQFNVEPSWEVRRKIKTKTKVVKFSTTINLTDIFSK